MHRKLILFCVAACVSQAAVPDIVKVDAGQVKGVVADGIAAFKGIPYAAPPVGAFRWKAPQPAAGWKGVRRA
jgi:para-nitrobenzyl esterase